MQDVLTSALLDVLERFLSKHATRACNVERTQLGVELRKHVCSHFRCLFLMHSIHLASVLILLVCATTTCLLSRDGSMLNDFLHATGKVLWYGRGFVLRKFHRLTVYRQGTALKIIWILHCLSAAQGLVLLLFQVRGGQRRRAHANRKLPCLPPDLQVCLRGLAASSF